MLGGASDITYRDRALKAEARVAELEAELAEYQAAERGGASDDEALQRQHRLIERLRPIARRRGAGGSAAIRVAKLLDYLLQHPGRLRRCEQILAAIAVRHVDAYETLDLVKVYVCDARHVLRAIGLGDAIETAWGRGYLLRADRAEALKAWCEGRV